MRKPAFCIGNNKGTDQLSGNRAADQHICLCYIVVSLYAPRIRNFKPLFVFCGCIARFVSDLVGNLEDRFFSLPGSDLANRM